MRNIKIGTRLVMVFLGIIALLATVSFFSITGMQSLSELTSRLYRHPYAVSTAALRIDLGIVSMHRSMKDVALAQTEVEIANASSIVDTYEQEVLQEFEIILERFLGDKSQIEETRQLFVDWKPIRDSVIMDMREGNRERAAETTKGKGAEHIRALSQSINDIIDFAENKAAEFNSSAAQTRDNTLTLTYILAALMIAISIIMAFLLTRSLTIPIKDLTELAGRVELGSFDVETNQDKYKDEMGGLSQAFLKVVDMMKNKAEVIKVIANGDLTPQIQLASEDDELGQSVDRMKSSLNQILSQVKSAVSQVNTGAEQITNASQTLSEGANDQATSLEEITSSIAEINGMSKQNASSATEAHSLAKLATEDAQKGREQMSTLTEIMEKINSSADEIIKIIKMIDDISFQINLLALNANVEAARAGKYGRGFAVVAEEVRNLAVRSATAVNDTTRMVEETVSNIKEGNEAADKTAVQLGSIVAGTNKVADFLSEISISSQEQAQGIQQINSGLDQIDQTTQANSASAEQSATSSEQLAAQANLLLQHIAKFKLEVIDDDPTLRIQAPKRSFRRTRNNSHNLKKNQDLNPNQEKRQKEEIQLDGDFEDF